MVKSEVESRFFPLGAGSSRAIHSCAPRVPRSNGLLGNEEGASATAAAGDVATNWQPLPFLSSVTSVPLVINNKTLRFPLPDGQVALIDKWRGSDDRAPFLNREQLLFSMLNGAYRDWTKKAPKEFYMVQTTHRGNGKTRLQLEWIYQALNKPEVVGTFLDPKQYTPEELKSRKIFINMLYEAAFVQRIIITLANVTPKESIKDQDIMLKEIILHNIGRRFANQAVQFQGKSLTITKELMDQFIEKLYLRDSILLFNTLVDYFCTPPLELPFDVEFDRTKARKMLILGLDECQDYSKKRVSKDEPDLVYKLLKYTAQHLPLLDHEINTCVFWLATGTIVPGHNVRADLDGSVYLLEASMDNLLHVNYLNAICQQYFKKSLANVEEDTKRKRQDTLHAKTSEVVVALFYRAFGLPRALEALLDRGHSTIMKMEQIYQDKTLTEAELTAEEALIKQSLEVVLKEFQADLRLYYAQQ